MFEGDGRPTLNFECANDKQFIDASVNCTNIAEDWFCDTVTPDDCDVDLGLIIWCRKSW